MIPFLALRGTKRRQLGSIGSGNHFVEIGAVEEIFLPDVAKAWEIVRGQTYVLIHCSCCHGAGRAKSRIKSMECWKGKDLVAHMLAQGVHVMAASKRTIAEEMPDAYKDVDVVVRACQEAGLANMVARLKPALVIKG